MSGIAYQSLDPLVRFGFSLFVFRHLPIGGLEILVYDVWSGEALQEASYPPRSDPPIEAVVHLVVNGDGELLGHARIVHV